MLVVFFSQARGSMGRLARIALLALLILFLLMIRRCTDTNL